MSRSHRINGQEESSSIISSNNVQFENSNTHNSNISNNLEAHIDSLHNQYHSSINSKQDAFDKTKTTMRKQTDTSSNVGRKNKNIKKRPSANSTDLKKIKKQRLSASTDHYDKNQQDNNLPKKDLEPIMEAPPLEKIVKTPSVEKYFDPSAEISPNFLLLLLFIYFPSP